MNHRIIVGALLVGAGTGYWYSKLYKKSNDDYDPDAQVRFLKPFTFAIAALSLGIVGTFVPAIAALVPPTISTALHVWLAGFSFTIVTVAFSEWRDRQSDGPKEFAYF